MSETIEDLVVVDPPSDPTSEAGAWRTTTPRLRLPVGTPMFRPGATPTTEEQP